MRCMDVVAASAPGGGEDTVRAWCKKMAPPLVTLLAAEPEVQYVALRNISLVVQKRPAILANEVKVGAAQGDEGGVGGKGGEGGVGAGGVGSRKRGGDGKAGGGGGARCRRQPGRVVRVSTA